MNAISVTRAVLFYLWVVPFALADSIHCYTIGNMTDCEERHNTTLRDLNQMRESLQNQPTALDYYRQMQEIDQRQFQIEQARRGLSGPTDTSYASHAVSRPLTENAASKAECDKLYPFEVGNYVLWVRCYRSADYSENGESSRLMSLYTKLIDMAEKADSGSLAKDDFIREAKMVRSLYFETSKEKEEVYGNNDSAHEDEMVQDRFSKVKKKCLSIGLKQGSAQYNDCVVKFMDQ